jgi:hypothetical protein
MTFDAWYAANVEKNLPADFPPQAKKLSREAMAACWNASLENVLVEMQAMRKGVMDYYDDNLPQHLREFMYARTFGAKAFEVKNS